AVHVVPLHVAVSTALLDLGRRDRLDLLPPRKAVLKDRLRSELIATMHDVELLCETGQEQALLKRGVAAADDREIRALEEGTVTDRAVRDAAAVVLLLVDDPKLRRLAADVDAH